MAAILPGQIILGPYASQIGEHPCMGITRVWVGEPACEAEKSTLDIGGLLARGGASKGAPPSGLPTSEEIGWFRPRTGWVSTEEFVQIDSFLDFYTSCDCST